MRLPLFLQRFPYSYRSFMCQERLLVFSKRSWIKISHESISASTKTTWRFLFFFFSYEIWRMKIEASSSSRRARLTIVFVEKLAVDSVLSPVCLTLYGFLLIILGILTPHCGAFLFSQWMFFVTNATKYEFAPSSIFTSRSLYFEFFVYFPRAMALCCTWNHSLPSIGWIIQIRRLDSGRKSWRARCQ